MFILSLKVLYIAYTLSAKFHPIWSCFGWVQKWLKFEFNSNLDYFLPLKNCQVNLFKSCINSGLQGYSHISLNPLHYTCAFLSCFLSEEKRRREAAVATEQPSRSSADPAEPGPALAPPAAQPSSRSLVPLSRGESTLDTHPGPTCSLSFPCFSSSS